MENKSYLSNYLVGFIGMVFLVTLLFFAVFLHSRIKHSTDIDMEFIFSIICALVIMMIYLYSIYSLKFIMDNICKGRAFCRANIKKLNFIGKLIIVAGILDTIGNYYNKDGVILISTSNGSIKPVIIVYMLLACFVFILAEVFKEAGKARV